MSQTGPPLIAPSILAADFSDLKGELAKIEGAADQVHVDVMDGHFVPNITIGPPVVRAVDNRTQLPLDVHLMIEQPERYVAEFRKAGADTIGIHVETCPNLHRSVAQIREEGARACVVLNPATPASAVEWVLAGVDQVLVMTVNPGFGGQSYIEAMGPKIRVLRSWIEERGLAVDIEVDGGVTRDTIGHAAEAGANVFVAGTAVFKADDPAAEIEVLRERAREGMARRR